MSASRLLRNGSPSLYMRSTLMRLVELGEVVDDFLEHVELHHALKAPGVGDHVAMPGRAERAFEIAGAGRIDKHHKGRGQRNDRFQRRAPFEIDPRLELRFHNILSSAGNRPIEGGGCPGAAVNDMFICLKLA